MIKSFECKGYWFLPNNPNRKISGILKYIPNEILKLELIGSFGEKMLEDFLHTEEVAVIHGITSENKKVTLFHCFPGGSCHVESSFSLRNYSVKYCLVGCYLADEKDLLFNKISVKTLLLNLFYKPQVIQKDFKLNEKNIIKKINFSLLTDAAKKSCDYDIGSNYFIHFSSSASVDENRSGNQIELTQNANFTIEKRGEKTDVLSLIYKTHLFLEFISLAAMRSDRITDVALYGIDNPSVNNKQPVKLYFIDHDIPLNYDNRAHEFIFRYEDIADVFQYTIKYWYDVDENIEPIRSHLISSIKDKEIFDTLDFLTLVQALEGYHRRFENSGRLKLKDRLERLVEKFSDIDKVRNSNYPLEAIVQSRDYYSHFFDKDEKPLLLSHIELLKQTVQLRLLLISCTLHLIGFDNQKINNMLNRTYNNKLRLIE